VDLAAVTAVLAIFGAMHLNEDYQKNFKDCLDPSSPFSKGWHSTPNSNEDGFQKYCKQFAWDLMLSSMKAKGEEIKREWVGALDR
jgi:hypothetical protein